MRRVVWLAVTAFAAGMIRLAGAVPAGEPEAKPPPPDVATWVADLEGADPGARDRAVDLLQTSAGAPVVERISEILARETAKDPVKEAVADAAAAVLAERGIRAGFVRLISRLDEARPDVTRWLQRASRGPLASALPRERDDSFKPIDPSDFDASPKPTPASKPATDPHLEEWRWLAHTTDAELAAPKNGAWGSWGAKTDDWLDYVRAIWVLQDEGNRRSAARLFAETARRFPESANAESARELAGVLGGMVEEDEAFREPGDPAALSPDATIALCVHRLRDVTRHQMSQPGGVSVLGWSMQDGADPASRLVALGDAAVPALLALIDDRRATRCVGYWRDFHPSRTVLRYQDAAVEILARILPFAPYRGAGTASYFSNEEPDVRENVKAKVVHWLTESKGKSAAERELLAPSYAPFFQALEIWKRIGADPARKEDVLAELRRRYDEPRRRAWRPEICEVMCDLGDTSKLAEVLADAPTEPPLPKITEFTDPDPDDGARFMNAFETVKRLRARYPTPPTPPAPLDPPMK